MQADQGAAESKTRSAAAPGDPQAIRALALRVAAEATLASAAELLAQNLARLVNAPLALLSRDPFSWRFEAHAFPDRANSGALIRFDQNAADDPLERLQQDSGDDWTAIALGTLGDREWTMLLPGQSEAWAVRPGFDQLVDDFSWSLGQVASRERTDYASRFQRRLHAFTHRLAREDDSVRLNSLVLQSIASQVLACTGALAVFSDSDNALAIVATLGYPRSLVEHLRIASGEGVLGRAYQTGRPMVGDSAKEGSRRLRYQTDSYMVVPVLAGGERLAVIALTDRADGMPFDARDFQAVRLFAAAAAPAFTRERLRHQLQELTELATVDPVTGLFNRRYFETRLEAEAERARRQDQDLALLLIDIDNFKHVNDTRGHLEGDRTLRDVADVLRAGVRIFDVCARYGGEEFVIVMPDASLQVAQQVAERIRLRIERRFAHDAPRVTVSIGVGMLGPHAAADDLIDIADRALIAAKAAGKNLVWTGSEALKRRASF
jgi:diguanylate cyclase (GGDEF)-like protein